MNLDQIQVKFCSVKETSVDRAFIFLSQAWEMRLKIYIDVHANGFYQCFHCGFTNALRKQERDCSW